MVKRKRILESPAVPPNHCWYCGREFPYPDKRRHYCDEECRESYYQSHFWAELRRKILDEAGWKCARCGGYAYEVHHITPISQGGNEFDENNLIPVCPECHYSLHRELNQEKRKMEMENLQRELDEKYGKQLTLCLK